MIPWWILIPAFLAGGVCGAVIMGWLILEA